jgi:hypothetical protein
VTDLTIIHLALSPRAARDLDELIQLAYMSYDGTALEQFTEPDETWDIFNAIRDDIKEQLPAKSKPKAKKKSSPSAELAEAKARRKKKLTNVRQAKKRGSR